MAARLINSVLLSFLILSAIASAAQRPVAPGSLDIPLLEAVGKGDIASVERLVKQGANLEAKDGGGSTPLMIAVDRNDVAMVKMLLGKGADIRAKDGSGRTPFVKAVQSWDDNTAIMKLLIAKGVTPKEKQQALFVVAEAAALEGIPTEESAQDASEAKESVREWDAAVTKKGSCFWTAEWTSKSETKTSITPRR